MPERSHVPLFAWSAWVVGALLLLPVLTGWRYAVVIALTALLLASVPALRPGRAGGETVDHEQTAMAVIYVGVVALMRAAFVGFGTDQVAGLFLCFAAALLLGVLGPVFFETWVGAGRFGRSDCGGTTGARPWLSPSCSPRCSSP